MQNEGGEYVGDSRLHLTVGVDDGVALVVVDEPDGQREAQLSPLGRGSLGTLKATGEEVQLGLGHGALQAEQ